MPLPADPDPALAAYAHPERLVTADWLSGNLGRAGLAIVESDEDVLLYDTGHIPGAVKIDWHTDLNDPHVRDYIDGAQFAELMDRKGIARDDTVVIYGDKSNWWAAYALWVFTLVRPPRRAPARRRARPVDLRRPRHHARRADASTTTGYPVVERDDAPIRAFKDDVLGILGAQPLIDVRSPQEYTGERTHMPDYPEEGALRGGHIPTAQVHPVGQGRRGQRPVPQPRRTRRALRLPARRRQDRRVLPHRRALQPHLVRADPSAGHARRAQLRRVVDRVGQRGAGARRRRGRARRSAAHEFHAGRPGRGGRRTSRTCRGRTSCSCCWSSPTSCRRCRPISKRRRWSRCRNASRRCSCTSTPPTADHVRLYFSAPAEAPTTRGFAAILAAGLDEQPADGHPRRARRFLHRSGPGRADQPAAAARHVGDAGPDQAPTAGRVDGAVRRIALKLPRDTFLKTFLREHADQEAQCPVTPARRSPRCLSPTAGRSRSG